MNDKVEDDFGIDILTAFRYAPHPTAGCSFLDLIPAQTELRNSTSAL
jgi:hypothetical protein